jgi:hypothetical protein
LTGTITQARIATDTTNITFDGSGQLTAGTNLALVSANNTFKLTSSNNFAGPVVATNNANKFSGAFTGTVVGSASTATNFSGSLSGDVTGTQSATVVASVGGQTAANVANATIAANAATSANTVSTIVKRDASGNFSAGTITGNLVGNASTATNFSGTLSGNVTGTQGATVVSSVGSAPLPAAQLTGTITQARIATDTTNITFDGSGQLTAGTNLALVSANNTFKSSSSNNFAGQVVATNTSNTFSGNGSGLTSLNGTAISSGPVSAAYLPKATGTAFGVVEVGSGLNVSSGTISTINNGTVTSVSMTGDGTIFSNTVPGSPITNSGTFVPALIPQPANTVLAGPASGSAAKPTFQAAPTISGANITSLNAGNLSSGLVATARLGTGAASSTTFLRGDQTWNTAVTNVTFTGDGTVLSSTPSSAVTTSGTVTASLAAAPANSVLGNFTGSSAAPTYSSAPTISGTNISNLQSTNLNPITVTPLVIFPMHGFGADAQSSSAVAASNTVYFAPLEITWPVYITNVSFTIGTLSAGGHIGISIYNSAKSKIMDTGPVSTSGIGTFFPRITNSAGAGMTLEPGTYYVAWNADNTTAKFTSLAGTPALEAVINGTTGVVFEGISGTAATSGLNPSTLGTLSAGNVAEILFCVFQ